MDIKVNKEAMMAVVVASDSVRMEKLTLGAYGTNAYIIVCPKSGASALVDAPAEPETIIRSLKGTQPQYILMTHNHIDHVGALVEVKSRLGIPLAANEMDAGRLPVEPDILLTDGLRLPLGQIVLDVLHTPGHTLGSVCFRLEEYLISGDTLFNGGPGRTQTPADFRQILSSLTEKVFTLPDSVQVFPGHGEATNIKQAREEYEVFASRIHNPDICGDVVWLKT